ncbi:MAG: chromate transporter [bacterium]|jgi:chromate transporter
MLISLSLGWAFFKVGLFAFGGGYAMLPLIQQEIVIQRGWLEVEEFLEIITISQMTPGPIAINAATFVGYKIAGLGGAIIATTAVFTPTLLIVFMFTKIFGKHRDHVVVREALHGICSVLPILILSAGIYLIPSAIKDVLAALVAVITFLVVTFTKVNPILMIVSGGLLGIVMHLAGL